MRTSQSLVPDPQSKTNKNYQICITNEIFYKIVRNLLHLPEQLFIILHSCLVMSSENTKTTENFSFVERFVEVCGSRHPSDIAQLLNISYQAAKNYLQGRLPDSKVLTIISEKTPYSVNWLLTGEGEKFVKSPTAADTLLLSDQMRAFVKQICVEVISEMLNPQDTSAQQKVVVLTSEKIKEEKVLDPPAVFSENEDH